MINYVYQLESPRMFSIKYEDLVRVPNEVIVKPRYMAICNADQRYYLGKRDVNVLNKKLPMALIHEACGEIVSDASGLFEKGQKVVMLPNVPGECSGFLFENYAPGSKFLSSGLDGFMREFVNLPMDRVVVFDDIPWKMAAITEFVSVAIHAVNRFDLTAHKRRDIIGIWGCGSLAFVLACILCRLHPEMDVVVIGRNTVKLANFSFVKTFSTQSIPDDFQIDHAFECAGGEGCASAIDDIIRTIRPQGSVMLMGVSENKVPINTRDVLEKGLTVTGCSRSTRADFVRAVELMSDRNLQNRINAIIYEEEPVRSVADIHRVFANDLVTPFKTVFKWDI